LDETHTVVQLGLLNYAPVCREAWSAS